MSLNDVCYADTYSGGHHPCARTVIVVSEILIVVAMVILLVFIGHYTYPRMKIDIEAA